jgi:RHS repeat-associated protein
MAVNNGPVKVTLQYDGDGNRVAKSANGTVTRYLVDDLNPTGYAQVVEELQNNAVTRRYTLGTQRISQTQLVSNTWTTSFYGYDGFGSVRTLTDGTGAVTDTYDYDYDAWGNAVNTTGSTPNLYLYRGEQYDPDLNLYYLRARYFNPLTGRFLSRDPAEGHAIDPQTLHRYLYVGADPVNRIDPSGRNFFRRM